MPAPTNVNNEIFGPGGVPNTGRPGTTNGTTPNPVDAWYKLGATAPWNYLYGGAEDPLKGGPNTGNAGTELAQQAWHYGDAALLNKAPQADFSNANAALLAGAGQAQQGASTLGQTAGISTQQGALAGQLQQAAAGQTPSVAELAMRQASGNAMRQNLAMAASGTGPSSTAALINAQNQNTGQQGQLVQQLGVQRAGEITQAREDLGNLLGQQRGAIANEAGVYGNLANVYGGLGQQAGAQALGQAGLQAGQNQLNQQANQYYYGQGANWIQGQAGLLAQRAANQNNFTLGLQSNAINQQQANNAQSNTLIGGGLQAAGTIGAAALMMSDRRAKTGIRNAAPQISDMYRGIASAAGQAATIGDAPVVYPYYAASDIRGKTEIAPAGGNISAAYRGIARANADADALRGAPVVYPTAPANYGIQSANDQANAIRSAQVTYPTPTSPFEPLSAASYYYKDPAAVGAQPGQQFGPMAQELEKTPAGASVVRMMPNGTKGIDTGRLALLNASETGTLRRDVDALKKQRAADMTTASSGGGSSSSTSSDDGRVMRGGEPTTSKKKQKASKLADLISQGANNISEQFKQASAYPQPTNPYLGASRYVQPQPTMPQPLQLRYTGY